MQFSLPLYPADWLPFLAAAFTVLIGLFALFAPQTMLKVLRLDTAPAHPEAVSEVRGTIGGFWLGTGLVALLFYDQLFVQMVLGAGWLFAAFGRVVSILADRGSTFPNWLLLALNLALAVLLLMPVLGFISIG